MGINAGQDQMLALAVFTLAAFLIERFVLGSDEYRRHLDAAIQKEMLRPSTSESSLK